MRGTPVSTGQLVPGWAGPGKSSTASVQDVFSHKVFLRSFCRSQLPLKSVNISLADIKNKLTDLCGN